MYRLALICVLWLCSPAVSFAATYYISPTGNNANTGTSQASPWLTFAHAINPLRASCGDTLVLLNGSYGDGTSTGKISITGLACTLGDGLTITALNQRKAKIRDSGNGYALRIQTSAYITIDGLYFKSEDLAAGTGGRPLSVSSSNHITIKNTVGSNPNRYINAHIYDILFSQQVLLEDNEGYVFHRHCVTAWQSSEVIVRRQYCNPRGGRIPGGFGLDQGPPGTAGAVMSMYPCRDCILENSIADGTTHSPFLIEMNATYGSNILMSGSKALGSICYKCSFGNGIYLNARSVADLNHAPQNNTIRDVAIIDFNSLSAGIRVSDGVNNTLDHITVLGGGLGATGILADDSPNGSTPATNSIVMTNVLVSGVTGDGFRVVSHNTWSGNEIFSTGNGTNFNPGLPANWTNTSTAAHGMGTCRVWVPASAAVKGAGTGGSDIGANVLYRYENGVLTDTPLWDQVTGQFPHGAADLDGLNTVAGQSLFDIHIRLNVNTGGCSFPAGYGVSGPGNSDLYQSGSGTTSASWTHDINSGTQGLLVAVSTFASSGNVGSVSSVTGCGGETLPPLSGATIVTTGASRRIEVFGKVSPTAGNCTLTVTTTGPVDAVIGASVEIPVMGSFGQAGAAAPPSANATPSVSLPVNNDYIIYDFLSAKCVPVNSICSTSLSTGANQTPHIDEAHPSSDVRLAVSSQSGANGGVMSHTMGTNNFWALVAVPVIPAAPGGGSGSTFRLSKYRLYGLHGTGGTPEVSLRALAPQDQPAGIAVNGSFRIRAEIIVETADSSPTGLAMYCRKNSGPFLPLLNTFASKAFRYYGPGAESTIPGNGVPTTQRFSGAFVAGKVVRDDTAPVVLPVIPLNTRVEVEFILSIGNDAAVGDNIDCEVRRDTGATLGTHTVTPRATVVRSRAIANY